jgi:chemotaxis protein histidine kinase CheA
MKERLRPLGGKLNIKSQLRNGTTIEAHIPFSKAAMKVSAELSSALLLSRHQKSFAASQDQNWQF